MQTHHLGRCTLSRFVTLAHLRIVDNSSSAAQLLLSESFSARCWKNQLCQEVVREGGGLSRRSADGGVRGATCERGALDIPGK